MSVMDAAAILAAIIVVLIKLRAVRIAIVVVCVVFGLVLGATSFGHAVVGALGFLGDWLDTQLRKL